MVIDSVPAEQQILLAKTFRNLSMDDTTLDALEEAGAIPRLVPLLRSNPQANEVANQVLMCMHYLCKIKVSRQEAMAAAGIVPHLQRFVREDHPLKQFALPIVKTLSTCSASTRAELKKHSGVEFFLLCLEQLPYWQVAALDALTAWLADDSRHRLEAALGQSLHVAKFVRVLQRLLNGATPNGGRAVAMGATNQQQVESVLNKLLMLLSRLPRFARVLGDSDLFVTHLLQLLAREQAAIVRKPILLMVSTLIERQAGPPPSLFAGAIAAAAVGNATIRGSVMVPLPKLKSPTSSFSSSSSHSSFSLAGAVDREDQHAFIRTHRLVPVLMAVQEYDPAILVQDLASTTLSMIESTGYREQASPANAYE
jgi:hypothetical protein